MLPALFGGAAFVWNRVNQGANFRAAISPDGIRLRHGLTENRAQTVPPGRVQAIRLSQTPLWHGKDWWRVEINVAGYGQGNEAQRDTVLHPVATRGRGDDRALARPARPRRRRPGGADRRGARRLRRRRGLHRCTAQRALGRPRRLASARLPRHRPGAGHAVGPVLAAGRRGAARAHAVPRDRAGRRPAPARSGVVRPALDARTRWHRGSSTSPPPSPRSCSTSRPPAPARRARPRRPSSGCARSASRRRRTRRPARPTGAPAADRRTPVDPVAGPSA